MLALVTGNGEARAADAPGAVPQHVGVPRRHGECGGVRLGVVCYVLLQEIVRLGSLLLVLGFGQDSVVGHRSRDRVQHYSCAGGRRGIGNIMLLDHYLRDLGSIQVK